MIDQSGALPTPEVKVITDALFTQLMSVMGLRHPNWITRLLQPIFHAPTERMSSLLVELDRNIARHGWTFAAVHFTDQLITNVYLNGSETIPLNGPLMVVCNHPAAYDVAILSAAIKRDDLKIIASDIAILRMLPNLAQHIIPVPYNLPSRLHTVRSAFQHLKKSGAILIFPRGNAEPDPAVSPGAEQSLDGWSASIELFLRIVPQTVTITAMASGMLSARWFRNPLIRLWKKFEQRQKVAEVFQIASQLITGKKPAITPMINFSAPLTINDLGGENASEGALLAGITRQARQLLQNHPHIS